MLVFNNKRTFLVILICTIIIPFTISGCSKRIDSQGEIEEETVIAKVNNYEIFASDIMYAVNLAAESERFPYDSPDALKAKENVLNHLITIKALIQEAQKQNFDKQKPFMKEIEKYWEQALLKFMIKKKSKEFSQNISINKEEIIDEYNKRKRRVFGELIVLNDKLVAEKMTEDSNRFEKIKQQNVKKIVLLEPAQWWGYEDLPKNLENQILSLASGDVSSPINYENNWAVIKVTDIKDVEIPPFEDISLQIENYITRRKSEKMLDEWISSLREKANVKVDYKVLDEIDLEELPAAK